MSTFANKNSLKVLFRLKIYILQKNRAKLIALKNISISRNLAVLHSFAFADEFFKVADEDVDSRGNRVIFDERKDYVR